MIVIAKPDRGETWFEAGGLVYGVWVRAIGCVVLLAGAFVFWASIEYGLTSSFDATPPYAEEPPVASVNSKAVPWWLTVATTPLSAFAAVILLLPRVLLVVADQKVSKYWVWWFPPLGRMLRLRVKNVARSDISEIFVERYTAGENQSPRWGPCLSGSFKGSWKIPLWRRLDKAYAIAEADQLGKALGVRVGVR